jgi:hypothetical protein
MPADARQFLFSNNATAQLAADVAPGDLSLAVQLGQGARFPTPLTGQIFKLTVQNVVTGAFEIMNVTARSGDALTVERAREGTTAIAFTAATAIAQLRPTAETMEKLQEAGAGSGGGSGAPLNAPYLAYAANADLTAEKVLLAETGVLALNDEGTAIRIVLADHGITNTKLRQSAGLSVVGRGTATTGDVADIAATSDGDILRVSGGVLGFGAIAQSSVTGLVTALSTLTTDLATLSSATTAALAGKVNTTREFVTQYSITGGGDFTSNRTINLVGDIASPTGNMYYGTNAGAVRGWYPISSGISDHSGLTGLANDDHTQYHNDARGDARYPLLTRSISTQHSLTGGGDLSANRTLSLVGDVASPGATMLYGTNGAGVRGWYAQPTGGGATDHGALTGLADDDHTQYHTDARGDARYAILGRQIATQHSLAGGGDLTTNRTLALVGDVSSPGNSMLYGTNSSGVRGWYAQPAAGTSDHGTLTGLSDDDHLQYHTDARGDARYVPLARTVSTQHSLTGGGSLSANRTLNLVNDVASPGNNMVYGTSSAGVRGWFGMAAHVHAAADITSGTLSDARLSTNVPLKNAANVFSNIAAQTMQSSDITPLIIDRTGATTTNTNMRISNAANTRYLGIDASGNLRFGSAADLNASGTLLSLAGHTHAATDIASGTLADARLSSNVPLKNAANVFTAAQTVQSSGSTPLVIERTGATTSNTNLSFVNTANTRYLGIDASGNLRFGAAADLNASGTLLSLAGHTHAAADITSGTFADARIAQSNVTQHQAALGTEAATSSVLVRRNSTGHIFATYFNQSSANAEDPTISQFMVTNGSDGYLRKASFTHVMDSISQTPDTANHFVRLNVNGYARIRVLYNAGTAFSDGLYLGYANAGGGAALTRLYGGGSTTNNVSVDASGNLVASGNVTAFSDIRLKKNIVEIRDALEKVKGLRGVIFDRTDTHERQTGLIAQEVLKVLPEAVSQSEKGWLAVSYGNTVGLLVQAIKELEKRVTEMEAA